MKIYIRLLLATIAFLIHIRELNSSSGHNEGGSPWPYWYPQQEETSQSRQHETPPQHLQQQQYSQMPYQLHTPQFQEPQLEQELHHHQTIQSETPRRRQIQQTPRQQQQLAQDPHLMHALELRHQEIQQELHQLLQPIQPETSQNRQRGRTPQQQDTHQIDALELRQQEIQQELHQLLQPIQSGTSQNRQRGRTPQQQDAHEIDALELRQQEIQQELHQLLQPIQSGTSQSRHRQRQEQPHLGQESNHLNLLQPHQQIEQELHRLRQQYPLADIHITDPPIVFGCFDKQLKASVAYFNGIRQTYACEVIAGPHFNSFIPDMDYRKNNIFAAVECSMNDVRCVAYVDLRGKVFGAKLPPNSSDRMRPGNPATLNPTASTSFITRYGQVFEVTQNPHTKQVQDIELIPSNRLMSQNRGKKSDVVRILNVRCCGMIFSGHKNSHGTIMGSELNKNEGPQFLFNPSYMPSS